MKRVWLFGDMNQAESRVVARRGPVPKLDQWYREGKDVHLHVTQLIAKVIQESRIKMPTDVFTNKPWQDMVDKPSAGEAREQSKRIVHGYNYQIGKKKMSLILRIEESMAQLLMEIYGKLFPEIASGYQAWIRDELKRTRAIVTPHPVRFRKVFWDIINEDTLRQAYASYPQIIVASTLNNTLYKCANIFREDHNEDFKEQWIAWYGHENWDRWLRLRDGKSKSPEAILWSGMDIRLNVHDAGGISVPDDSDVLMWAARTWRRYGEVPIEITPEDPLTIPIDFKVGPTWGDLHDYKLAP